MNSIASTPRRLILALVAAGALGGTGAGLLMGYRAQASTPAITAPAALQAAPGSTIALPSFAQITAQNGPAVVNISVTGSTKAALAEDDDDDDGQPASRRGPQLDPSDPFYEFFRQFGIPGAGAQGQRNVPTHG